MTNFPNFDKMTLDKNLDDLSVKIFLVNCVADVARKYSILPMSFLKKNIKNKQILLTIIHTDTYFQFCF